MSLEAASTSSTLTSFEQLSHAREVLRVEGKSLLELAERLDYGVCRAIELVYGCQGNVIVTGMGKAGLVGQKIAATLASTGTRSHYLHPAEAVHGDLGRIQREDIVMMLSQSGDTDEVVRMLPALAQLKVAVIAITGRPDSALGRAADVTLDLGRLQEAGGLGLAPTTSTTAMLALGDAVALVTSQMRGFGVEDFARFHPGGSLGRRLAKVAQIMRPLEDCRVADDQKTVRRVLIDAGHPGRRSGAILLVDDHQRLCGIFTDSDLARLLEEGRDDMLDLPIAQVMTQEPTTVLEGTRVTDAVEVLAARKISELPVIDDHGRPLGLVDITDVLGVLPQTSPGQTSGQSADSSQPTNSQVRTVRFSNHGPGKPRR